MQVISQKTKAFDSNEKFYFSGASIFYLDTSSVIESHARKCRRMPVAFAGKSIDIEQKDVVIPLNDPYGTTIYDTDFEAIVVSEETEPTAVEINNIRVSKGMKPLDIVVVSFVLAYDGNPISSTRIRRGEINQSGNIIENRKK